MPEGLEYIGGDSFGGCVLLTEFNIPSTVTQIEMSIFGAYANIMGDKEYSLQKIIVSPNNAAFQSIDGVVYSKDGKELIWYPDGRKNNSYAVADGTEIIGEYAINNAYIENISLLESVKVLEKRAFSGCYKLKDINLPEHLEKILPCVFEACWEIEIEQNRCAMACQGCGAVFTFMNTYLVSFIKEMSCPE